MASRSRRRGRSRFARLRRTKNALLGAQVLLVLLLAGYLLLESGLSLDPLFLPLSRVLHLLLFTALIVALQGFVFRALAIKHADREGQRYLLVEQGWRRGKRAAVLAFLVALLLLTPPVQAMALNLVAPQAQRELGPGASYPLAFPNQDPLGIAQANALWVAVQNGELRVTVRDGAGVMNPGEIVLRSGEQETLSLPADGYAVLEVTFENLVDATTTFSYRVSVGLPPAFTSLVVLVAVALGIANLAWLAYLRRHRAGRGVPDWPPPQGGPQAPPPGAWSNAPHGWNPVYNPWRAFPGRGSTAPAPAPAAVTAQELPPPPPQVEPYGVDPPPPPLDAPLEDPARALLHEVGVDLSALLARAEDRVAAGEYQEALEDYETVLHFDSGNLLALLMKADLLDRLGRPVEALQTLGQALERDPYHQEALLRKGALLEREGQTDEALECYETILRGGPAFVQALVRKGDILARVGEAELAWEAYTEALRLTPDDPHLREQVEAIEASREDPLDRARRERAQGRPEEAEAWYLRALDGDDRAEALRELAGLYLEGGRTEEALPVLDEAILEAPRDVDLLLQRAWALADRGRLADALDACEGACELGPDRPAAWALRGDLEARLDLRDRAVDSLRRALEGDPGDAPSAAVLQELERRIQEEADLAEVLREVEGVPEEGVAVLAAGFGSLKRLRKAKVRALVELEGIDDDLAKRVLRHVRKRR